jgi:hypothetical protein
MSESQLMEFYKRVAQYERARSQGYGFEADGTLGRSYFHRPKRRSLFRMAAGAGAVVFILLALKAGIILFVGEGIYADRIERMNNGQDIDRLGAAILKIDPVSSFMVDQSQIWAPRIMDLVLAD